MRSVSVMQSGKAFVLSLSVLCCGASCRPATAQDTPGPLVRQTVAPTHDEKVWRLGAFVSGGFPPFYEVATPALRANFEIEFYGAGLEAGRLITQVHGPEPVRGRLELAAEVIPFWLAHYPRQLNHFRFTDPSFADQFSRFAGADAHGVSLVPLIVRWNFERSAAARLVPWAQVGGGLLFTTQRFPLLSATTTQVNFEPQAAIGVSVSTVESQRLEIGAKSVHISNAGLGDNPGINITTEFQVGYFWRR